MTEAIQVIIKALKEIEWGEEIEPRTWKKLKYIDEWCDKIKEKA